MKKSNVTFIAAALIAVHVLIFIAVIGKRERNIKNTSSAPPPVAENHQDSEPLSLPDFKVPELELPEPALPDAKPRTTTVPESRELIATPGTQTGYLRYNRPDRRTTKVYSSLVSTPYQGAIVVDARTGKILFENRAAAYAYPASVTKLMTLLIVLEQIDAGKVRLDDKITITREVSGIGGSEIFLDVRESGVFTVDDMLNALIIHSANDAARALAVHVAGTREAFVDMMNKKARELGMNSTVYHSEHGLPPEAGRQPDISTAYDIAILSLACLRHTETLGYTGTKLAWLPLSPIRKEKFMLANRNALVGREPYPGCDGLKTGYHKIGGWSLAATAERDGQRIISVVLGAPDKTTRNNTTRELLDRGFKSLER